MRKQKGISLIVLVITIIVMIILAGSIILTLSNNGIINKASDAVDKSDEATVNQIAQMAWAEAYAQNETSNTKKTGDVLIEYLEESVKSALEDNGLNRNDYGVIATTKGVDIAKGWLQRGIRVVKGNAELGVGDHVDYNEGSGEGIRDVEWQVLGAENGELLILSSELVANSVNLGEQEDREGITAEEKLKYYQNKWFEATKTLNDCCKQYGEGYMATGARCIKAEDIDRITGFDDKMLYKKDSLEQYGNEVTFYYNGTKYPSYTSTNGNSGNLTSEHNIGFNYFNGTELKKADLSNKEGKITTLKNNAYGYNFREILKEVSDKAYNMLKGEYWLANLCIQTTTYDVDMGIQAVDEGNITQRMTWSSSYGMGHAGYVSLGVRAVVSLSKDTNLNGDSDSFWRII